MTIRARQVRVEPHVPERVPEAPIDADILRIPVGPGALHVDRYGHGGTPVVLLHGFGTSSFLWRTVGPALALAKHTAFAIDLLGYGESDRPYEADYGIAAQAEYLDRAMTALRISSGVIVGLDLGGGVALRLAAARPERVGKLVLVNSVGFDCVPGKDIAGLKWNTAWSALRVSRGVLGAAPLLVPILEKGVTSAERMPPRLQARYLAPYVGSEGVSHLLMLARSVHADDLEDLDLSTITAPSMVVWGEEDPFLDDKLPDRLINAIPDARLVRLPNVGRLVPEEAPDELARLILEFMAGRGSH